MIKSQSLKKIFLIFVCIGGEFAALLFAYLIKQRTNNLELSSVNIFSTGNFINLILSLLIALILVFNLFYHDRLKLLDLQIVLNFLFVSILLLIILAILFSRDFYAINRFVEDSYRLKKTVGTILWFMFFFVKLITLNFLLLKSIRSKSYIYLKAILLSFFGFGLICFIALIHIILFSKVNERVYYSQNEKYSAVVVLGAAVWKGNIPSPVFAGRLDRSIELFKQKVSPLIVTTGGNAPNELPEGEAGKLYLISKGIPKKNIITETQTSNTLEQIHFIKKVLIDSMQMKKIIVVSDRFHLPRVIEIAEFLSLDIKVARSKLELSLTNKIWYSIKEAAYLSVFWLFAL